MTTHTHLGRKSLIKCQDSLSAIYEQHLLVQSQLSLLRKSAFQEQLEEDGSTVILPSEEERLSFLFPWTQFFGSKLRERERQVDGRHRK